MGSVCLSVCLSLSLSLSLSFFLFLVLYFLFFFIFSLSLSLFPHFTFYSIYSLILFKKKFVNVCVSIEFGALAGFLRRFTSGFRTPLPPSPPRSIFLPRGLQAKYLTLYPC